MQTAWAAFLDLLRPRSAQNEVKWMQNYDDRLKLLPDQQQ
jgi:hypothetical protein